MYVCAYVRSYVGGCLLVILLVCKCSSINGSIIVCLRIVNASMYESLHLNILTEPLRTSQYIMWSILVPDSIR